MTTVILSPKGEITIPAELCEKYGFDDWGLMSVIDMGNGSILLKPHTSELDELAKRIQETLKEDNVTLDDVLQTLDEEHKQYFKEKYGDISSHNE